MVAPIPVGPTGPPIPPPGPPPGGPMAMPPPGGPAMGPPPGGPAPPPDPASENIPPLSFRDQILRHLKSIADNEGDDVARAQVLTFPEKYRNLLYDWQGEDAFGAMVLDPILPPKKVKPEYPWYITEKGPPPKPNDTEARDAINRDYNDWSNVREEIHLQLLIYHMIGAGAFNDYDPTRDELFYDGSLVGEVNSIIYRHANTEVKWRYETQPNAIREDGEKSEDFVEHVFKRTSKRYRQAGNHDLRRDVAWYLAVTGYACARTGMRFLDQRNLYDFQMCDPGTTVPTYDDNGLRRVTRRYQDTVANVIANYDSGKGEVRRLLLETPTEYWGTEQKFRHLDDFVLVETYEDRWWRGVWCDDKSIIPITAHELGYCPWVYVGSNIGEPMQVTGYGHSEHAIPISGMRSGDYRTKLKHQSYFAPLIRGHRQREAILSKLYTLWKRSDKPTWMWMYDDFSKGKGAPEAPTDGSVTPLDRNHEEMRPLLQNVNPAIFGTLFQADTAIRQRTDLPLSTFGEMEGTQQSGNQMEVSAESGYEKEYPILIACESFYTTLGELWLNLWRDWGFAYFKRGEQAYGEMTVPYQGRRSRRHDAATFCMVPAVVQRVGTDIEATLPRLRVSGLAALGNGVAIWKNMALMSDYTALEMRGVTDPDEELAEIEYDEVRKDPDILKLRKYKHLKAMDVELAELYRDEFIRQQQLPPPGGPMGPLGSGPGPLGPQGNGPPAPPVRPNTSAMNLQALGMGPQGPTGRPQGITQPSLPSVSPMGSIA